MIGAGALNQCVKAIAIARGYVVAGGLDLVCVPSFADIEIDGERRTGDSPRGRRSAAPVSDPNPHRPGVTRVPRQP